MPGVVLRAPSGARTAHPGAAVVHPAQDPFPVLPRQVVDEGGEEHAEAGEGGLHRKQGPLDSGAHKSCVERGDQAAVAGTVARFCRQESFGVVRVVDGDGGLGRAAAVKQRLHGRKQPADCFGAGVADGGLAPCTDHGAVRLFAAAAVLAEVPEQKSSGT